MFRLRAYWATQRRHNALLRQARIRATGPSGPAPGQPPVKPRALGCGHLPTHDPTAAPWDADLDYQPGDVACLPEALMPMNGPPPGPRPPPPPPPSKRQAKDTTKGHDIDCYIKPEDTPVQSRVLSVKPIGRAHPKRGWWHVNARAFWRVASVVLGAAVGVWLA